MDGLTPSQKGAAAEAAITARAIEMGLVVLRPLCEGHRYDIVIDLDPELLRVQCKCAWLADGVLVLGLDTHRLTPRGYVSTTYTPEEIDAIAAYSSELKRCYLIPIAEANGRCGIHLRLDPARNNQARGIRWAKEYELEQMLGRMRGRREPAL